MKSKTLRLHIWGENQKRGKQHFEMSTELAGAPAWVAATVGRGPVRELQSRIADATTTPTSTL
jgi:hypothetical protein